MARIKINYLPRKLNIIKEELRTITGGAGDNYTIAESFDQKSNMYYMMLSNALKYKREMETGIARNIL